MLRRSFLALAAPAIVAPGVLMRISRPRIEYVALVLDAEDFGPAVPTRQYEIAGPEEEARYQRFSAELDRAIADEFGRLMKEERKLRDDLHQELRRRARAVGELPQLTFQRAMDRYSRVALDVGFRPFT